METILVTGATGLLGSSLVPYLKNYGYKVVTHGRNTRADVMADLTGQVEVSAMLDKVQPSAIINLVSLTNVDLCEQQVNLAYLANTRSVENIVHWMTSKNSECHLIQVSTDHIYDGHGLHSEDNVIITNNYALTKYAGELSALNVPSTILRTNFLGRSRVSYRESFSDWLYKSLSTNQKIQVLNDVFFSPLSINMLVEMIRLVLEKRPIGVYNLGSKNGMSKADLCFSFAECCGFSANLMESIDSVGASFIKTYRPRNMMMDSAKFEKALGVELPNLMDLIKYIAQEYHERT
jgi:dTDP-4-dehydrorhamnose reductase